MFLTPIPIIKSAQDTQGLFIFFYVIICVDDD